MINLHYLPEIIPRYLGDGSKWELEIHYSREEEILGTAGGIGKVGDFFKGETFVVMNADILVQIDLQDTFLAHKKNNALSTMVVSDRSDVSRYGVIGLDEENRVRRITNRVGYDRTDLKQTVFLGIHVLEPEVLEYFPKKIPSCINADVYPDIIRSGGCIHGYIQREGYWSDLGTPTDYLQTHWDILENKVCSPITVEGYLIKPPLPSSGRKRGSFNRQNGSRFYNLLYNKKTVEIPESPLHIDPSAVVREPVWLGSKVIVHAEAEIGPYCVIGDHVQVENKSRISESILWQGSRISERVEMHGCVVDSNTRVPPGIYREKFITSGNVLDL